MGLISIITATYNSSDTVEKTYQSIREQSYTEWEWLITDDCSTDNTLEIIEGISQKDSRVKVYSNPVNSGAAVSRNNSLNHVAGTFIAFIDSDDLWQPNKLDKQLDFMGNNIDFSFTGYGLIDEQGSQLDKFVDINQSGAFGYHDMLKKKATLGCSTVMLRRNAFTDISMPLLRTGQDYATWLKLLKSGKEAHLLNEVLTHYRIMPNSISRNKFKKAKRQWQIYRGVEKLPLLTSVICFYFYAYRAVFRK
ncbi:MAG: glycosyltransferase [Colwellia sp.]|nr:glycosyltransferase [Colwellia sp.]